MNWAQFKYPGSNKCLAGAVVVSWSYTRGGWEASLSNFTVMTNMFVTQFRELSENNWGKTQFRRKNCVLFLISVIFALDVNACYSSIIINMSDEIFILNLNT